MNNHEAGKDAGRRRPAPAELLEYGDKEDGKRIPDPEDDPEVDEGQADDDPSIEKPMLFHQNYLLSSQ